MTDFMQRLESEFAVVFGRGPSFYPLSPAPLAPLDSLPERAPVAVFSEEPANVR